jgi:hypothetical protein
MERADDPTRQRSAVSLVADAKLELAHGTSRGGVAARAGERADMRWLSGKGLKKR